MSALHGGPRVLVMPDRTTILSDQPIHKAERALDEAASAAYIDMKRAEFDAAVENHCMWFGFDKTGELL